MTATLERCAGTTTPTSSWPSYGRTVRPKPCARPVAFVVEDGSNATPSCTAHLGGLVARAAAKPARGQESVSVWALARWTARVDA